MVLIGICKGLNIVFAIKVYNLDGSNICYILLIIATVLMLVNSFNMDQIISSGQLDIKHEMRSFEYSNGTIYYNYENSRIDFVFKYPANWQISEFNDVIASNDQVISFKLDDSEIYKGDKDKHSTNYFNYFYSYFPSTLSILSYDLNFNNISIEEFARIKVQDLQILFSDFNFTCISNNIKYIGRENIPAWKFEYSIESSHTLSESFKDKRYGQNIWILKGNKVYEIEYIANAETYLKNIDEVTKLIDSIRFR